MTSELPRAREPEPPKQQLDSRVFLFLILLGLVRPPFLRVGVFMTAYATGRATLALALPLPYLPFPDLLNIVTIRWPMSRAWFLETQTLNITFFPSPAPTAVAVTDGGVGHV